MISAVVLLELGFSGGGRTRLGATRELAAGLSALGMLLKPGGDGGLPSAGVGVPGKGVPSVKRLQVDKVRSGVSEGL